MRQTVSRLPRTLIAIATLLTSISLAAAPIRVDDSGVDYSNSDLATAYLNLEESGGRLTVVLADQPTAATALPVDMAGIPVVVGTSFFGSTTYSGVLTDPGSPVQVELTGTVVDGVSLEHPGTAFTDAIAAYQKSLEQAGDSVAVELDGNYAVITGSSGARIVLQNVFDGVRAHIATL